MCRINLHAPGVFPEFLHAEALSRSEGIEHQGPSRSGFHSMHASRRSPYEAEKRCCVYKNIARGREHFLFLLSIKSVIIQPRIEYYLLKRTTMNSIIITPRNRQELQLVNELLKKMKLSFKTLSAEEIEDIGLTVLLKKTDRTKKAGRDTVMKSLRDQRT